MHSHRAWAQTAVWFAGAFFIGDMAIEFLDKWPHLVHIISVTRDDKADIMSKRNTLCQHINNVLCFFASRDPITKLKLMKLIAVVFMVLFCGIWLMLPYVTFA